MRTQTNIQKICREFRDAGQERIHERGGRKLFEEGIAFLYGLNHEIIDKNRGGLLLQASRDAGCKIALVVYRMDASNLSDEDKQKLLKDLKEISTSLQRTTTNSATGIPTGICILLSFFT